MPSMELTRNTAGPSGGAASMLARHLESQGGAVVTPDSIEAHLREVNARSARVIDAKTEDPEQEERMRIWRESMGIGPDGAPLVSAASKRQDTDRRAVSVPSLAQTPDGEEPATLILNNEPLPESGKSVKGRGRGVVKKPPPTLPSPPRPSAECCRRYSPSSMTTGAANPSVSTTPSSPRTAPGCRC